MTNPIKPSKIYQQPQTTPGKRDKRTFTIDKYI